MAKSKVMFMGEFEYIKKSDGKTKALGYNLAQFLIQNEKKICKTQTFFSDYKLNLNGAEVGDFVECEMEESLTLGGRPNLVSITPVEKSTIFD